MIRSLRLLAIAAMLVSLLGLGAIAGLFLFANAGWVPIATPSWPNAVFGDRQFEVRLPVLLAGWLATAVLLGALVLMTMFYVWRQRQYESLVNRLERELAQLRNLPFTEPAPLEDLPEAPSTHAAQVMQALDDEGYDAP